MVSSDGAMRAITPVATVPSPSAAGISQRLEALLVVLGSAVLTIATNVNQVMTLTKTVSGDLGDPLYFAWQLAWVGHAVRTDPGGMWTTNAFLRAPDNLAFTDTVLGYLPLSFLVPGGQSGALAQLNLAGLISTAVSIMGAYLLARVLGARIPGALVAGAGFGFAPWRLTQVIHINVVSTGGVVLTLALLAYGHGWSLRDGWRPERIRPRWTFVAWVVACWQMTFGFATGIWFVYTLAIVMVVLALGRLVSGRRRPDGHLPRGLLVADGLGGVLFLGWVGLLVQPYLRVLAANPDSKRVEGMLELFSPPWNGLLTAPESDWFWSHGVWSGWQTQWRSAMSWPPEMQMSPGLVLLGLAVLGLFYSSWGVGRRLGIAAVTAVLTVLSMGTTFADNGAWTYVPLYQHAPGWENLRTPGRLMIWVTIGLCLLAAGAVTRFCDRLALDWQRREEMALIRRGRRNGYLSGRTSGAAAALACVVAMPAALVVGEGINQTPHWEVARSPITLASLPQPILLLPSALVGDYHMMLWSTEGWPVLANGDSGFAPAAQRIMRDEAKDFPDAASVAALRKRGIATVVVIRSRVGPDQWQNAPDKPVAGLGITRTDTGDAVVFDLR